MRCNERSIRHVLFAVDTTMSKDTHRARSLFPLISFVICPFFQQTSGKLTSFTSIILPMYTF